MFLFCLIDYLCHWEVKNDKLGRSLMLLFLLVLDRGKTLQTISLLAYLRETRGMKGPHLIVVPKSVVGT